MSEGISRSASEEEKALIDWLVNANILVMQTTDDLVGATNLVSTAFMRVAERSGCSPEAFDFICRKMSENYKFAIAEGKDTVQ